MNFTKGRKVEIVDSSCMIDGCRGTLKSKVSDDMFLVKLDASEKSINYNLNACVVMLPSYSVKPL